MKITIPTNQNHETASMPTRLLRRGIGTGAAVALLTAGAASAAPAIQQHAAPTLAKSHRRRLAPPKRAPTAR